MASWRELAAGSVFGEEVGAAGGPLWRGAGTVYLLTLYSLFLSPLEFFSFYSLLPFSSDRDLSVQDQEVTNYLPAIRSYHFSILL